jgi:RES domain-containing protein
MFLWRISNYSSLNGAGGLRASARWHSIGRPIVYTADHPAGALAEMLVHVHRDLLPDTFQLMKIKLPDNVKPSTAAVRGTDWRKDIAASRRIGDRWLDGGKSAVLRVPSAILPDVFNYLINPLHRDAKRIRIVSVKGVETDERLRDS